MDNTSTSSTSSDAKNQAKQEMPRKATITFLRQFARIYTYEPRLKPNIASLIPN
ncbi:MAG: hypothetical protein HDS53_03150 [Barnesiella sp.]|nr:hypothetical protein [Barnesiella sp.]